MYLCATNITTLHTPSQTLLFYRSSRLHEITHFVVLHLYRVACIWLPSYILYKAVVTPWYRITSHPIPTFHDLTESRNSNTITNHCIILWRAKDPTSSKRTQSRRTLCIQKVDLKPANKLQDSATITELANMKLTRRQIATILSVLVSFPLANPINSQNNQTNRHPSGWPPLPS